MSKKTCSAGHGYCEFILCVGDMTNELHFGCGTLNGGKRQCIHVGNPIGRECKEAPQPENQTFDLITHLHRQKKWSQETFGPGARLAGVLDHIQKEIEEVRSKPTDLEEWIDLVLLSFDGAWRAGYSPEEITLALNAKQTKNESRNWPDWRDAPPDKAIEHIPQKWPWNPNKPPPEGS